VEAERLIGLFVLPFVDGSMGKMTAGLVD